MPGDDPAVIASGPTVGDASTAAEALALSERWGIALPDSARAVLDGPSGVVPPGDPRLARVTNRVIAAPIQSLEAAADMARAAAAPCEILGDALEGEARDLAAEHAGVALSRAARWRRDRRRCCCCRAGNVP